MSVKVILAAILACHPLMIPAIARTQTERVKINFKVDGKEVEDQEFKILIYAGDKTIEPKLVEHGFIVPPEVSDYEKVDVRLIFGKYDLRIWSLTKHHFDSRWTVSVKNPPFNREEEAVAAQEGKELKLIYSIKFSTTVRDTFVFKEANEVKGMQEIKYGETHKAGSQHTTEIFPGAYPPRQ
ncbi:MAG TPA: hypothetical protein VF708_09105 [Pyrinomonadaceae bacterium]